MATQIVTISLNANGKPVVDKDPLMVDPGDTVIWELADNLHWPPDLGIVRKVVAGSVDLFGSTLPNKIHIVNGNPQGIVLSTAGKDTFEDYTATVDNGGVILSSYEYGSFDPKIQVKK